jgi:hypothetical protein
LSAHDWAHNNNHLIISGPAKVEVPIGYYQARALRFFDPIAAEHEKASPLDGIWYCSYGAAPKDR